MQCVVRLLHTDGVSGQTQADFDTIKQRLVLVRNRMRDFQDEMYPDQLVLERGNTIRGRIIGESLQGIRLATPLGPQEIPRERVKKPVYATSEESRAAEELLQLAGSVDALKREFSAFERKLIARKKAEQKEAAEASVDSQEELAPADAAEADTTDETSSEDVKSLNSRITKEDLAERPAPLKDRFADDDPAKDASDF